MVRTQSQVSSRPFGIDPSRVLAMSTAVALHLLAGGLLLIPLSHRAIPQQTAPKERWLYAGEHPHAAATAGVSSQRNVQAENAYTDQDAAGSCANRSDHAGAYGR